MNQVVPWTALVALIQPHARGAHQALGGRPPFAVETMLRIHCLQLWWNLSDPAMEEELHERPLYRRFAGLDGSPRIPDETTILRFRHLLEPVPPLARQSKACVRPHTRAAVSGFPGRRCNAGKRPSANGRLWPEAGHRTPGFECRFPLQSRHTSNPLNAELLLEAL